MKQSSSLLALLLPALGIVAGCGGSSVVPGGGEASMDFGGITTRVAGTVQPPVTSGDSDVVVTGVAGGNFTAIRLLSTAPPSDTGKILFHSQHQIGLMNADGTGLSAIPIANLAPKHPRITKDGTRVVFSASPDGADREIYAVDIDGGNLTRLTNNSVDDDWPCWSPDASRIAYATLRDGNWEIYTMDTSGNWPFRVTNTPAEDFMPDWSPDGTRIAFVSDPFPDDPYNYTSVYTTSTTGTNLMLMSNAYASYTSPRWSPDGNLLAMGWTVVTLSKSLTGIDCVTKTGLDSPPYFSDYNGESDYAFPGIWSPDGSRMAFLRFFNDDRPSGIYTASFLGSIESPIFSGPYRYSATIWDWIRDPLSDLMIGTGGVLGTNASGFLYARSGSKATSLLTFECSNRNSARVTTQTSQANELSDVVFTLSGDLITKINYINLGDAIPKAKIAVGFTIPNATNALVDVDARTGQVVTVIPYTSNRGVSTSPVIAVENGNRVFRGNFPAVYGPDGKNLAGNGAREVRVDLSDGTVRIVR